MGKRKSFSAFVAVGLVATAAFSYRAVAQNAEEGDAKEDQQGKMMMQCPMMEAMKSVQLYVDSPTVLLAQSESLELNSQQQEKLKEIAATARQRARDVLSETQRDQLQQAPQGPLSPMQLTKLQTNSKAGEGKGKGKMCPMCMKMMRERMQEK